jgi:hypothetical protein
LTTGRSESSGRKDFDNREIRKFREEEKLSLLISPISL